MHNGRYDVISADTKRREICGRNAEGGVVVGTTINGLVVCCYTKFMVHAEAASRVRELADHMIAWGV